MIKKFKKIAAFISAIAMLSTTATVLPERMSFDFGTGITASAAGTEQQSTDEATVYQPAVETTDKYDIDDGGAKVYQIEKYSKCDKSDTPVTAYSNTDKSQVAEHIIENGFCVNCDYLQPAVLNSKDQYEIGNAGQLYWFAKFTNESENNSYFSAILTSDIVVNENVLNDDMVPNEGTYRQWTPIGKEYDYKGTFNGNNHTISGLYYNDSSYCKTLGFICTAEYSEIKNLGIVDSYFFANVSTNYTGGICAESISGRIVNCFSICTIEGYGNVGGICGILNGDYLINCYSLSSLVKNSGYRSDKIYADGAGDVDNCYFNGGNGPAGKSKTNEEFENGTVAYLLAKGSDYYPGENSWGQNLDNDEPKQKYPSLGGAKVYEVKKYSKCDKSDTPVTVYSNTDKEQVPAHVIENGFCKNCDYLQPAVMNSKNQYEIGNAGQLYWFAKFTNESESNSNADAILTSDIVVNENVLNDELELNKGDYRKWTPISSSDESNYREFQGTFDGNNHTISGLYFNDTNYVGAGLISTAAESSKIMNLGIVDSYFEAGAGSGAICGDSVGSIMNCFSICRVYGEMAGGICGAYSNENNSSGNYFINCYSLSKVSGIDAGTICGQSLGGIIDNCYTNEEPAIGMDNSTGWTYKKTIEEFENGTVAYLLAKGSSWHPIATPWGQNLDNDEPKQKYPSLGGAKVYQVNRYSTCDKSGTPTIVYSNYDKEIYDEHIGYEENNGFCACGEYQAAVLNENGVYEIGNAGQLYWFAEQVNSGEEYLNAVLTADIVVNEGDVANCNGTLEEDWLVWIPIGSGKDILNEDGDGWIPRKYCGTFDGQNHTISGLYCDIKSLEAYYEEKNNYIYAGLFGYSRAIIKNVGVVNSYFEGEYAGGIVGDADNAAVLNCYNASTVKGTSRVGGICGNGGGFISPKKIENCFNVGKVIGSKNSTLVGGILGTLYGNDYVSYESIKNCYYDKTIFTGNAVGVDYTNNYTNVDFGKTTEQFASGEVAMLLGDAFGQTIGTDKTPVLGGQKVYNVKKYSDCGKTTEVGSVYSNSEEDIAPAHDYSNGGICNVCNGLENGKDGFKSASVSLTDGVIVNYNVILSKEAIEDENAHINFKSESGINKNIKFSEAVLTGETYRFSLELRPDQMSETITAQVIYGDGTEGNSVDFSIKEYSENLPNEKDKKLADSMKLYGAFAQAYTGRKTDNLVSDIKDYETNATIGEEYNYSLTENASGIKAKSATLQIGSQVTIVVKYQLEEGKNISDYDFMCGDESLEPVKNGNYYCVYLKNILPQDLDKMYEFVVKDNAGNETTLKYSAFSYMKSAFEKADSDKKLTNLLNAMYDYNKAAEDHMKG